MKHLMIGLIRFYKKFISPILPPACRFTPTCSEYAIEAFSKRGFFVGFILTVWRILRCNPFCKAGHDPVPDEGLIPTIMRKKKSSDSEDKQSAPCSHHNRDAQENPHQTEDIDATNTEDNY